MVVSPILGVALYARWLVLQMQASGTRPNSGRHAQQGGRLLGKHRHCAGARARAHASHHPLARGSVKRTGHRGTAIQH